MDIQNIEKYMTQALKMARLAFEHDEVPVGAVIVMGEKIIGKGFNQVIQSNSVASHAEINAINQASQYLKNYRLKECDIFVTLEPCHMCAKAIVDARINSLYFGTNEPKKNPCMYSRCSKKSSKQISGKGVTQIKIRGRIFFPSQRK